MRKIFFNNVLLFLISIHASAQCWQSISSSTLSFHNVGIQTDGTLWTWGNNADGQLGDGTTTNRTLPTQVGTDTDWVYVVAGNNATYAIKQNGTLWAWGGNDKGQLSDGTTTPRLLPAQVLPGTTWNKIYSGHGFIVAQKTDGTLWSCGQGSFLGFNDSTERHSLEQINTDTDWMDFNYLKTIIRFGDLVMELTVY
jgi:alpha-tubulin suppressor-like RCC1 family protein